MLDDFNKPNVPTAGSVGFASRPAHQDETDRSRDLDGDDARGSMRVRAGTTLGDEDHGAPAKRPRNSTGVFAMALAEEKYDIAELFSHGTVIKRAKMSGLRVGWAIGEHFDEVTGRVWDLRKGVDKQRARKLQHEDKPRMLLATPPCTLFSSLQNLRKTEIDPDEKRDAICLRTAHERLELETRFGEKVAWEGGRIRGCAPHVCVRHEARWPFYLQTHEDLDQLPTGFGRDARKVLWEAPAHAVVAQPRQGGGSISSGILRRHYQGSCCGERAYGADVWGHWGDG